jgi:hypothetical protein
LGISVQKFTQKDGQADFMSFLFGDVYLAYAISRIQQRNSIEFYASLGNSEMESPAMIVQEFGEEHMSSTRVFV